MQLLRAFLTVSLLAMACCRADVVTDAPAKPAVSVSGDGRYDFVDIPVCKTSIYIGFVKMTTGRFVRQGDRYLATYQASVFPFFFYREKGTIGIRVDSESLSRLAKGETIRVEGTATTDSGEQRRIEGTAIPSDSLSGTLKIKIHVTRAIKLAFTTSYRFVGSPTITTSPDSR